MMLRRSVVALLLGFALCPALEAQVSRIDHHKFAWQERRRRHLLELCREADPGVLAKVAADLTRVGEGVPPLTINRALARLKGVEPDAAFLFRAGLEVYALPEVVARPRFEEVPITVYAPYLKICGALPLPESWGFEVRVRDAKGKEVFRRGIEGETDMAALREFRVRCPFPCKDLPKGWYEIEVMVEVAGQAPRATDIPLTTSLWIDDSYATRAQSLRSEAFAAELQKFDLRTRALLLGAADIGRRAWHGTPGLGPDTALRDLRRAEQMRANAAAGRAVLVGQRNWVTTGMLGDADKVGAGGAPDLVFVTLRLPADGLPKRGSEAWKALARKPLLLFFAPVPQLDVGGSRPSSPRSTLPMYLAAQLAQVKFDAAGHYQVCVVESPGRWSGMRKSLGGMLEALAEVFPHDGDRLLCIGDGHGAAAAVAVAMQRPGKVRGLVLCNSTGGLATPELRALAPLRILALPGRGAEVARSLETLKIFVRNVEGVELQLRPAEARPWCLGLPLAAGSISALARQLFSR